MEHPWDRRLGVWYLTEDFPDSLAIVDSPQVRARTVSLHKAPINWSIPFDHWD